MSRFFPVLKVHHTGPEPQQQISEVVNLENLKLTNYQSGRARPALVQLEYLAYLLFTSQEPGAMLFQP